MRWDEYDAGHRSEHHVARLDRGAGDGVASLQHADAGAGYVESVTLARADQRIGVLRQLAADDGNAGAGGAALGGAALMYAGSKPRDAGEERKKIDKNRCSGLASAISRNP